MPTTSETYQDALNSLSNAYANEFSDYAGTMSYLDGIWEQEIDNLINGGVSYFPPYPTNEPPVSNFFDTPLDYLHDAYATYVPATAGIGLKQMAAASYGARPIVPTTTFGDLMGHFLKNDSNALFSSLSDASTAAKVISQLAIGASAMGAGIEVMQSQTPLSEGQKQGFALSGMLIGAEAGAKLSAAIFPNPFAIGIGTTIGAVGGTLVGTAFYENVWPDIHDNIINNATSAINATEIAFQGAKDYVDDIWDETGQAAQDLFSGFIDGVGDFVDGIGDVAKENNWPPAQTPDFINEALAPYGTAKTLSSPLILDLDSDGIELTAFDSLTTITFFDIDGDSFAEQTAWVSPDDGLLARDVNANGLIDDVTELFGSPSVDGFSKLVLLDSNGDLLIDQYDDAWSELRVWQDSNGDAVTQGGELISLSSLSIESIDLAGVIVSTATISGNSISHESTFKYTDGTTGDIVDAWFVNDDINTYYSGDYALDIQTLYLPTLRGFGEIKDLHIAMSLDSDLLTLVEQFANNWDLDRFAAPGSLDNDFKDIMLKWAGVESVDPISRGSNVDARHLEFLEKLLADDYYFLGTNFSPNPSPTAGAILEPLFETVLISMKAHLLMQLGMGELYSNEASYSPFAGAVEGTMVLSLSFVDELEIGASQTGVDAIAYWLEVAKFIEGTKGIDNLTTQEETWLDSAVLASGSSITWSNIVFDILGLSGEEFFDVTINGSTGDDVLTGSSLNEIIYASSGNDIIHSGGGSDQAYGWLGDDVYFYSSGDDYYSEYGGSGTDSIKLPSSVTLNDLVFSRVQDSDLFIQVSSVGTIQIGRFFDGYQIESIEFEDLSIFDLTSINGINFYGTVGVDDLRGENDINETIYGFGGDDELWGYDGDDVLDGGAGNDILKGMDGNDTYVISEGFDDAQNNRGTDTVYIPEGYTLDDVAFLRTNISHTSQYRDLVVSVENLGQLSVIKQFYTVIDQVELVYFAETDTTINFTDIQFETRGTAGNDSLNGVTTGGSVDDILNGMEGDDYLFGGQLGNDTYVFSEGIDTIEERSGTDNILFWERWSPEDITIYRGKVTGNDWTDLVLEDTDGNILAVNDHFESITLNDRVEYVNFYDSTQWDIYNMEFAAHGTEGDDSISSYLYGDLSSDSTVYGFGGNDNIAGYIGNDYLDGGAGNDVLQGSTGDDTYIVGLGLDTVLDSSGLDALWITGGHTINDITLATQSFYDIKIVIDSGVNEVVVEDSTPLADSLGRYVEIIKFDDGFATDLPTFASWLWGTSGDDVIVGDSNDNTIIGMAGNDIINAGAGNDDVHGGADNDNIHGDDGDDLLYGGVGDDTLNGGAGADIINGGLGADTAGYNGSLLAVTIDLLNGTASGGDAAGDTLISIENITGSNEVSERDYIWGDDGSNSIEGLAGNDVLEGGAGADIIDGGTEWDSARYIRSDAGVTINLASGVNTGGHAEGDVLVGIEVIVGSAYNDNVTGDASRNFLFGENGDDILSGGLGDDLLKGGSGADTYVFEAASAFNDVDVISGFSVNENDVIDISDILSGVYDPVTDAITDFVEITTNGVSSELRVDVSGSADFGAGTQIATTFYVTGLEDEADLVNSGHLFVGSAGSGVGTSGDDVFIGTSAAETFDGLAGADTVDYSASVLAVNIDLLNNIVSGGDAAGDTLISIENITGSNAVSERDYIWGDDGSNSIEGLAGNDVLEGGAGADIIDGGTEWDYARYIRSDAGVTINLASGVNTGGHAEGDVLVGIEVIVGSAYNDNVTGDASRNFLFGENGDDILSGGLGDDLLKGGSGADTYVFEAASAFNDVDEISGFSVNENDAIDITDILSSAYDPLTDVITDFVEITTNGSSSELRVDSSGSADFSGNTQIATLSWVTGLEDEAALVNSGHLLVA